MTAPILYGSVTEWLTATSVPKPGSRRPNRWAPNGGFVILNAAALTTGPPFVSVAGQRPGRDTLIIVNTGTVALLVNNEQSGQTPITLGVGAVFTLESEGEVWLSAPGAVDGLADMIETWWDYADGIGGGEGGAAGAIPDVFDPVHGQYWSDTNR